MVRKKVVIAKNINSKDRDISESKGILEDKIIYAMANTSVILMSTMMGAFTQVIGSTMGIMASGMAEAMGGKEASNKVDKEIKKDKPELDAKINSMISDIRKDIYSQMKQRKQELEQMLSDPTFAVGPKIIEKYDFKMPKLTQELDDNMLSMYSQLLINEDGNFGKMFKELTEWMNSLPKAN
jgi:hypothetical protein